MIAGVVLSAGASRRMGSPKALARIGNKTFLDSMIESLHLGGCDSVLAVLAHHVEEIKRGCDLKDVQVVINPKPELGQISSLMCAVDAARESDGLLFVLVDQAMVSPDTVRRVAAAVQDAPCAVARYKGGPGHPTAFSRELFERLSEPEVQERGARVLVDELERDARVKWVDVDDPGVTRNINTPEELGTLTGRDL